MLGLRLRRRPNIKPTLDQRLAFAGDMINAFTMTSSDHLLTSQTSHACVIMVMTAYLSALSSLLKHVAVFDPTISSMAGSMLLIVSAIPPYSKSINIAMCRVKVLVFFADYESVGTDCEFVITETKTD